jgi:hypothetical protein
MNSQKLDVVGGTVVDSGEAMVRQATPSAARSMSPSSGISVPLHLKRRREESLLSGADKAGMQALTPQRRQQIKDTVKAMTENSRFGKV